MNGLTAAEIAALAGGVLYFPLEMAVAALLFSWPLKRREHFILRLIVAFLTCTSLMVVCETIFYGSVQSVPGFPFVSYATTLWCCILFVLSVLLVWTIHALRFREALYCGACAYLMEHLAYCVRILCGLVLPEEAMEMGGGAISWPLSESTPPSICFLPAGWYRMVRCPPPPGNRWPLP